MRGGETKSRKGIDGVWIVAALEGSLGAALAELPRWTCIQTSSNSISRRSDDRWLAVCYGPRRKLREPIDSVWALESAGLFTVGTRV